eukprot:TRINITY_DN5191_c0_g2_i1.p1 TRINITY_DN5191_c0_g2~~TRINITY_DN5191_c0_g2_i1.p1  ORF type:complete len:341 (+),score=113.12 TRINITY_DN5191_c0_g2_i1:417-1439(+)
MSNLFGYLFGNLTKDGKLEDADEDTQKFFEDIGRSSLSGDVRSLGLEADDLVNNDEEPQEPKTKKKSNGRKGKKGKKNAESTEEEKAPDAIDFEDETEVADDFSTKQEDQYYQKALSSISSTSSIQLTSVKKEQSKETNYDEDYDMEEGSKEEVLAVEKPIIENGTHISPLLKEDILITDIPNEQELAQASTIIAPVIEGIDVAEPVEEEPPETQETTPQAIIKPTPISAAVKTVTKLMVNLNNNKNNSNNSTNSNNNNNNARNLTLNLPKQTLTLLRAVCSSIKSPSGPILKFSEIFTPKLYEIHQRKPRRIVPEPQLNEEDLEKSQENIFYEVFIINR